VRVRRRGDLDERSTTDALVSALVSPAHHGLVHARSRLTPSSHRGGSLIEQQRDKTGASVGQPVKSSWNYTGIFPNVRLTAYVP
jgi:hypothetical protein